MSWKDWCLDRQCVCVSVFLCAMLLMGQEPEIKWIELDSTFLQ